MIKSFSTAQEDLIIAQIFEKIRPKHRYAVEFGARDGYQGSNIRLFMENGWTGLQFDNDYKMLFLPYSSVKIQHFTCENINDVFAKNNVPKDFDLLSLDVDCNDYWLWKKLDYLPNVVCIEYNSNFDYDTEAIVEYNPDNEWDYTMSYGASFASMNKLAKQKGYYLYAEADYSNLIFVKKECENLCPPVFSKNKTVLPHEFHHQQISKKFITDSFDA